MSFLSESVVKKQVASAQELLGPAYRVEANETGQGTWAIKILPIWYRGSLKIDGKKLDFEICKVNEKGGYNVKVSGWITYVDRVDELVQAIQCLDQEAKGVGEA